MGDPTAIASLTLLPGAALRFKNRFRLGLPYQRRDKPVPVRAGTIDVWLGGWNVYEEAEAQSETEMRNVFWETEGWRFI